MTKHEKNITISLEANMKEELKFQEIKKQAQQLIQTNGHRRVIRVPVLETIVKV